MASHLWTVTCFALAIPVSLYTYVCLFQTLGLAALLGCFHSWTRDCWERVLERKRASLGRCVASSQADLF